MVKGPIELPATPVTAPGITPPIGEPVYLGPKFVGDPSIPINIPGLPKVNFGPITSQAQFRSAMSAYLTSVYEKETNRIIEQYQASVAALAPTLQKELDTARGGTYAGDFNSVGVLLREINLRESAMNQKTIQRQTQQTKANSFYSADFSSKGRVDFIRTVTDLASSGKAAVIVIPRWQESLAATYQARYLGDQIALLNAQTVTLREQLAVTQARLAAEAEAARVAAEAAAAEAARLAAEAAAAEAARIAAEAKAKRIADEAAAAESARIAAEQAEQVRLAEAIRIANTFRAPGAASAIGPVVITAAGTIGVIEATTVALQAAIRSAVAALNNLLAGTASGLLVGVSALVYSPKLANGELPERYTFSTPLSDLDPQQNQDLHAIAATGGTVNLPVRLSSKTAANGQSEVIVVKTDSKTIPSSVRVVAATYDAAQNVYSVSTGDTPPRTLTWTPIVNPGNSSTTSPAEQAAPPVYTGATVTPVEGRIDTFPGVADAGFDDFIIVFPVDSGLPPIYVMFRDRREDPGVVTGVGQPVSGIWLGAASQGEGAPIPSQIADQLRGKEFKNFREFREKFWKAVANDPQLAKQFDPGSVAAMAKGYAAYVRKIERVGARKKYELHHKSYISAGGEVFNIDNISVVTPKRHIETHQEKK